ncbi:MAG: ribosome biogenesis GTP-binding protein YihA/YsxC [Bacilli bacterium]
MLNFHDVHYVISCPDYSYRPKDDFPEVVFLGRSNVGKSSLINSLCLTRVAFASKKAGKTRYLNYFLLDKKYYLVDAPGYGFTHYGSQEDETFGHMMETYFDNPLLKGAVLLLDARRVMNDDDKMLLKFLKKSKVPMVLVFTKSDLAKQSELANARAEAEHSGLTNVYFSYDGKKIDSLRAMIAHLYGGE